MLSVRKRKQGFYVDCLRGAVRIRGTLGTRDKASARQLGMRIEAAMSAGKDSPLWRELKAVLPESTFARFAGRAGVKERQAPTWEGLRKAFEAHLAQRVVIGKFRESTLARYKVTLRDFGIFLEERKITLLEEITKPLTESFKAWKIERINGKKFSRGGTGLVLDAAILHRVFSFAVENEWVAKNPVRMEGRPGDSPRHGAEPFTADELSRLREHVGDDLLTFLLLRHTGLRGGDAVTLTWEEVHFPTKEIERVTRKRRKKVILPIHPELLFALEAERDRRKPQATDFVLLNPFTGTPLNRPRLYERVKALGMRAGVPNAHPHRFRDTLAVDTLLRGGSVYDVAKALGDTVQTVERHYAPFVPELRERLRKIMESPGGLEDGRQSARTIESLKLSVTPASHHTPRVQ
jgi:integrase